MRAWIPGMTQRLHLVLLWGSSPSLRSHIDLCPALALLALLVGVMQVEGALSVGSLRQEGLWVWMEQSGDSEKERWVGVEVWRSGPRG